ncbi:hypothetical protein JOC94_004205 [Bacillus thermophilus]|uniref:Uncharacterized protein n=1 Tax=Siminovitchia thermophila TaxID=1245522 RepID=A0ABS2RCX4_9BACI|nr:hypothetical protein [Siminovitchia thermophila]MBM7717180.1 hypothetical protein [Siminovitchia thermophila]
MSGSILDLHKNRTLLESDGAQEEKWSSRDLFLEVLTHFMNHSPCGAFSSRGLDLSNVHGCVNVLYVYGLITAEEKDLIVNHYNNLTREKGERGA